MSDYAKFCPKCYAFFRDPNLFAKHIEICGFAKDRKTAAEKTADGRPQTAAEKKESAAKEPKKATGKETTDRRRQTVAEKKDGKPQSADGSREGVENPLASAAVSAEGGLPSAVSAEGNPTSTVSKPAKFKT